MLIICLMSSLNESFWDVEYCSPLGRSFATITPGNAFIETRRALFFCFFFLFICTNPLRLFSLFCEGGVQRFNTLASGEEYQMVEEETKPKQGSVHRNAVQLWRDSQFGRAGVRADWVDSL